MRFPTALFTNQLAVNTDFMDAGACDKSNIN